MMINEATAIEKRDKRIAELETELADTKGQVEEECGITKELHRRIAELEADNAKLREAGQAFVDVLEAERLTTTVPVPRKVEFLWIEAERLMKKALGAQDGGKR